MRPGIEKLFELADAVDLFPKQIDDIHGGTDIGFSKKFRRHQTLCGQIDLIMVEDDKGVTKDAVYMLVRIPILESGAKFIEHKRNQV